MQSKNPVATIAKDGQGKQMIVLGHAITAKLYAENTEADQYVFECVTPPGLGIPLHINRKGDAVVTVIEGEYSVVMGDKRFEARKGDVCFFPHNVLHSFQCTGTKAGTTMWAITPGANFEAFFTAMGNLPAGDPDPATIARIFAGHEMEISIPG